MIERFVPFLGGKNRRHETGIMSYRLILIDECDCKTSCSELKQRVEKLTL
jgi:hypothetical protein